MIVCIRKRVSSEMLTLFVFLGVCFIKKENYIMKTSGRIWRSNYFFLFGVVVP